MAENLEETMLLTWREERDELNKLISALEKRIAARRGGPNQADLFSGSQNGNKQVVVFNEDRPITLNDGCERLLRDAGRSLHAKVLVEGLARWGKKTSVNSVAGSLPQDPKKRFKKTAPSTFGLAEWENKDDGA
jgi:hypothetical protein